LALLVQDFFTGWTAFLSS